MNRAEAITKNSFRIIGRGIVVELGHSQKGLAKDTKLTSITTGRCWTLKARVIFEHAVPEQKIFEIEKTDYMLIRFDSLEKKQRSIDEIKSREAQGIYQYVIDPIDHEEKPDQGEILEIHQD